jgi:hypothetical protein
MIYKKNIGDRVFNGVNYFFLILIGFLCLYPMIYILAVSLSGSMAVLNRRVFLWPVDFNIEAYKTCFESKTLAKAYLNTILYTTSGTALNLIAVTLMAYPLSKRRLIGRRPISFFFYFTNLFSGGLIPTFLVVKSLNFVDKIWALIVPGCVSVFYAIILRTNFESIPADYRKLIKQFSEIADRPDLPYSVEDSDIENAVKTRRPIDTVSSKECFNETIDRDCSQNFHISAGDFAPGMDIAQMFDNPIAVRVAMWISVYNPKR